MRLRALARFISRLLSSIHSLLVQLKTSGTTEMRQWTEVDV
jgi:hypothetical protein